MNVVLRAYNDGMAFRFLIPQASTAEQEVLSELTGFNFADDFTAVIDGVNNLKKL